MAPVTPGHWRLRQGDGAFRAIQPGLPRETMSQTKQTESPNQTKTEKENQSRDTYKAARRKRRVCRLSKRDVLLQ